MRQRASVCVFGGGAGLGTSSGVGSGGEEVLLGSEPTAVGNSSQVVQARQAGWWVPVLFPTGCSILSFLIGSTGGC